MKKIAFLLVLKGDSSGEIYLKTLGFRGNMADVITADSCSHWQQILTSANKITENPRRGTGRQEDSPRLSCPKTAFGFCPQTLVPGEM